MDDDNLLIICRVCGRKVLMHNMRPDPSSDNMLCIDCYKKSAGVKSATSIFSKKNIENSPFDPPKSAAKKTEKVEKMIKYVCSGCKYKFSRKESQHVQKCPYCGRENIVLDSQLGAEKIIAEATSKKYEW